MNVVQREEPVRQRQLRLWPGIAAVVLQWLLSFGVPRALPDAGMFGVLGGLVAGLAVMVWWAFFSRAPRYERLGGLVLMIAALAMTPRILHPSIATGMMGMMFVLYALPFVTLAFVIWAGSTRGLSESPRRALMVVTILLACAAWALFRTDGITGEGSAQLAWRWSKTHEEKLLAQAGTESPMPPPLPSSVSPQKPVLVPAARTEPLPPRPAAAVKPTVSAEWPGFRGPARNSVVHGVKINTDWAASPPVQLWRRPIGPGWSSFAVDGDLLYTQEQRGDHELVACYRLTTGQPVWAHRQAARFWESNAGAGPRGTPTLSDGRVYTFGATGIVNALDARNGSVVWSRNAASDAKVKVPGWGFSSSPLIVEDLVIVAAAGKLVAYDVATGNQRWLGQPGGGGYSSPHLVVIDKISQVLLMSGSGATSVSPADGKPLWQHSWQGTPIIQPAMTADGDLLISTSDASGGLGTRRIKVAHGSSGWTAEERWTSAGLKPYFNDFVVHNGHAYGFDARILACIDLKDGSRKWKGGRYGHGQLILLHDQDLLLVLSEEGELALVGATPTEFTEVSKVRAIEGKTWNHPVLVRDILLARNGEEMAAFRLASDAR